MQLSMRARIIFCQILMKKISITHWGFFPVNLSRLSIDRKNKKVKSSFFVFIAKQVATYYENGNTCGCVLGMKIPEIISNQRKNVLKKASETDSLLWPRGNKLPDSIPAYIDIAKLNQVLEDALKESLSIYAIVIAQNNLLITEQYQTGINKNSRLLGWSMTKTIANALFGILEKNGLINTNQTTGISEWQHDERKKITINNLLQMSSGLQWTENYAKLSSVTRMLYLEKEFSSFAINSPLIDSPNEKWLYSSGTSNILSKILRSELGTYSDYVSFPYDSLFYRINMNSAVIEMDNYGNYVLSSYGWATARDWTKFGLLYLNEGNWFGDQIFSRDWLTYSTTPAPASNNVYGAHIWLNKSGKLPSVSRDAYYENGFGGQRILIVPSKNMVITVMSGRQDDFNFDNLYSKIFNCFESY